jgi:uncharacterized repeat protein (TIGR03803 family)
MKTTKSILITALLLAAALGSEAVGQLWAQTLTTLYTVTGANPDGLVVSGGTVYGKAGYAGDAYNGALFKLNADGTGYTVLHSFAATPPDPGPYTNSDGASPSCLFVSSNSLYGTAMWGGLAGNGTVFKLNTDGTNFAVLHSFGVAGDPPPGSDGAYPTCVTLSGNTLYGTTAYGGTLGVATVFSIGTDGTGFRTLHTFTNEYEAGVYAGVIVSGDTLYGTTSAGCNWGCGTVFKIHTDGTGFAILHRFIDNLDGSAPDGRLVLSGNTLYGTTRFTGVGVGGLNGTLFKVNTDGTGFAILHQFSDDTSFRGGVYAESLTLSDNTLYGTTEGDAGLTTVFKFDINSSEFTTLFSFVAVYMDGLTSSGTALYGVTHEGGLGVGGTVFTISLLPQLAMARAAGNLVLTWPTNATGFTVQSTTNLDWPTIWTTDHPAPVVVNGQNTISIPSGGKQQFYRLSH